MRVTGINEVNNFLNDYIRKVEKEVDTGMREGGELILKESKAITPRQSGHLINETEVLKNNNGYEVNYTADYSVVIHEDLERRHTTGQAKFLETATNKNGNKVIKNIANKIGRVK